METWELNSVHANSGIKLTSCGQVPKWSRSGRGSTVRAVPETIVATEQAYLQRTCLTKHNCFSGIHSLPGIMDKNDAEWIM